MKKVLVFLVVSVMVLLTACGSSADVEAMREENEKLKAAQESLTAAASELESANKELTSKAEEAEKQALEAQEAVTEIKANLEKAQSDLEKTQKDLQSVKDEYASYKEKMKEYEGLSEAEAEARLIEAERIKAEEAEEKARKEEEARQAAEEAAREAEEKAKQGYETGITYDQLARNPEAYENEKVKFTGEVLQVLEGSRENTLRLSVHKEYGYYDASQVLYCGYDPSIIDFRLLEDDEITIYGYSIGLYSYEAVSGATITLPAIWIDKIEMVE